MKTDVIWMNSLVDSEINVLKRVIDDREYYEREFEVEQKNKIKNMIRSQFGFFENRYYYYGDGPFLWAAMFGPLLGLFGIPAIGICIISFGVSIGVVAGIIGISIYVAITTTMYYINRVYDNRWVRKRKRKFIKRNLNSFEVISKKQIRYLKQISDIIENARWKGIKLEC